MSELRQVKAAAGSGKTYSLTERFLSLLQSAEGDPTPFVCAGKNQTCHAWPEILAATFTNKAAAEMKLRVVTAIKRAALDIEPDKQRAPWKPARASAMLARILRRYHQLNVRTIDSLLNLLLKLFALEAGIAPDYELVFDESEMFQEVFDRFLARCDSDADADDLLEHALSTLVDEEGKDGFWPAQALRKRIFGLVRHLREHPGEPVVTDQKVLAGLLGASHSTFMDACRDLSAYIEDGGLPANANFKKFLVRCAGCGVFDGPPDSVFAAKDSLCDCINAAGRDRVEAVGEKLYAQFKDDCAVYRRERALLAGAYYLVPSVALAEGLLGDLGEVERGRNQVLNLGLPGLVGGLLSGEAGVPDAYCRLGGRLHHMLVDEFQDTSRAQWAAMSPLAEECLAKGGGLFYVGDVKQAIYGWRGGDADLFDEVRRRPELAGPAETNATETLPRNWRSKPEVVAANNDFFGLLEDPAHARELADAVLAGAPEPERETFARAVVRAYEGVRQIPPDPDGNPGHVRMTRLPGGQAGDVLRQTLDAVESLLLDDILTRRPFGDVAVLVRTHDHAAAVSERLVARGVPVVTESSLSLANHPLVRELAALLGFLDYPDDDLALAGVLTGETVLDREGRTSREELLDWLAEKHKGSLWMRLRDDFPDDFEHWFGPLMRRSGLSTPYDLAAEATHRFRLAERYPDARTYLLRFLEVIHLAGERGMLSLGAFLQFWRESGTEEKAPLPESVDAVRIMTIHKSKGLEFPVVVAPFHQWTVTALDRFVREDTPAGPVLVPLRKDLGESWWRFQRDTALEQLNLLYVAWTRARDELYGFYPGETRGTPPAALAAVDMLLPLALPRHPDLEDVRELGPRPAVGPAPAAQQPAPAPESAAPSAPDADLPAWLPRLRVYRHMEDVDYSERTRGSVAHRAMEYLRVTGDAGADTKRALDRALDDFPVLHMLGNDERDRLHSDVGGMLDWVLTRPDLRDRLADGRHEPPLVDGDGQAHRPDFVHFGPDETVVLEFKTGGEDPDHPVQVRRYLSLLREMDPDCPASGLIVYLDKRTTVTVEGN